MQTRLQTLTRTPERPERVPLRLLAKQFVDSTLRVWLQRPSAVEPFHDVAPKEIELDRALPPVLAHCTALQKLSLSCMP